MRRHTPSTSTTAPNDLAPAAATTAMTSTTASPPALLDRRGLASYLAVSVRTLDRLDASGRVPQSIRVGTLPRWRRSEIDDWIVAGCPTREVWETLWAADQRGGSR